MTMLIRTNRLNLELHRADIYLKVTVFGWTYETFRQFWRGGSRTSELYRAGSEP
ncbi:hypothetical protein [Rhizobium leguminosarum]|uniref:hypothetical protein n=1 Tax=Rhizobium leguminosarum TaxID=384 RepID=UPI0014413831|nr:hypothetical protein [Rhizobium leguminosarum]